MDREWTGLWDLMIHTQLGLLGALDNLLLEKNSLPALWFQTLKALAEAPDGRLRVQALAEQIRHSQSGTTRLVDRLEKEGLVERKDCPEDRRAVNTVLCEKGRRILEEASPNWEEFLKRHLVQTLTPEERDTLVRLLTSIREVGGQDLGNCTEASEACGS